MSTFRASILNPLKFKLFKLSKLPMAYIAGLKVKELTDDKAVVTTKYGYLTQNPFKSMYFAVQAMAAELSTGVLVLDKVSQQKGVKISTLVTTFQADYSKKAIGKITFTCPDGNLLNEVIEKVMNQDEGEVVQLTSIGTDEQGDVVSTTKVTWSLRAKRK